MRHLLLRLATRPLVDRLWRPAWIGTVPILMLHRFHLDGSGGPGLSAGALQASLDLLQRRGIRFLRLDEAVERLLAGSTLPRAVVMTVDDGYQDFDFIAHPIFQRYGCPVTVFLTTGLIDGEWMWWDRVEALLGRTERDHIDLPLNNGVLQLRREAGSWGPATDRLVLRLKTLPDPERREALGELERLSGGNLPDTPPAPYQGMSWERIDQLGSAGVTFGAHTVSHPILSRVTPEAAEREILGSWAQVRSVVQPRAQSRVFCYPNGQPGDFSSREEAILQQAGFLAAVTTTPGYAGLTPPLPAGRYRLPRFAFPRSAVDLLQISTGFEAVKMRFRGALDRSG